MFEELQLDRERERDRDRGNERFTISERRRFGDASVIRDEGRVTMMRGKCVGGKGDRSNGVEGTGFQRVV